ncbi:MAG: ABC transporter permease [Lentisphaeria bacterium]|nr:ABC transporter permease [Lentisphaeria bacterium]
MSIIKLALQLLRQCTFRHWCRSPWISLLLMGMVGSGVAIYYSVALTNRAAVGGFRAFTDELSDKHDYNFIPKSGLTSINNLGEIRGALGNLPVNIIGMYESTVYFEDPSIDSSKGPRVFPMLSLDLIGLQNVFASDPKDNAQWLYDSFDQYEETNQEPNTNIWKFLAKPGAVFIDTYIAKQRQLKLGDEFELLIESKRRKLFVAGILPDRPGIKSRGIIVTDFAQLPYLLEGELNINMIQVAVEKGVSYKENMSLTKSRLEDWGGEKFVLQTTAERKEANKSLLKAFRFNLSLLSSLSFVFGIYLIVQALEAAVVRRRKEIATLSALGVNRKSIYLSWMMESLIMGLIGSILGLLAGYGLASLSAGAVSDAVNHIYFNSRDAQVNWHWGEATIAFGLGMIVSLIAGHIPAQDAASTPPAQMLALVWRHTGYKTLQHPLLAIFIGIFATIILWIPPYQNAQFVKYPIPGFLSVALFILAGTLITSTLLQMLGKLAANFSQQHIAHYAFSHLRFPSGRHVLATAGLSLGTAMAVSIAILIFSFQSTMKQWLGGSLKADLFIAPHSITTAAMKTRIPTSVWETIVEMPQVKQADLNQSRMVVYEGIPVRLMAVETELRLGDAGALWTSAPDASILNSSEIPENMVMISEPLANRFALANGDFVSIPTPSGPLKLEVGGIFKDFTSERGMLTINQKVYRKYFKENKLLSFTLTLNDDVDRIQFREQLGQAYPGLLIRDRYELRSDVEKLFDRTFSITYALELIAGFIAIIGFIFAFSSLVLERKAERKTLQMLGVARKRVAHAAAIEGSCLAFVGLIIGNVLGVIFSQILIQVIQKQSFGWTLATSMPWPSIIAFNVILILAAALTSYKIANKK